MKKILTVLIVLLTTGIYAQNVGINSTGAAPSTSAMLDVDAAPGNDKGLLIPRVALLATNNALPIIAPANSLMVYNTAIAGTPPNDVVPGYYYWNGTKWIAFGGNGSADWSLTGNAGTVAGTNFIGTTDAVDFTVFTNNTEKVRVTSAGNVGIGTTNPNTALDVSGSVAFRETSLTLANGNNNDINAGNATFITISGPSSAFAITGITAGTSGRLITLYNSTTQPMTISNQSTSSASSNRIVTLTGSDLIGVIGNGGSVQLQYSTSASRWIVLCNGQSSSSSSTDVVELVYDLPSGSDGAIAVAGAWTTRAINTKITDLNNICTLSSNQFTLPAGTYKINFNQIFYSAISVQMQFHSRIRNITDGVTTAIALTSRLHIATGESANSDCPGIGVFTITSPKTFEIQYFSQSAYNLGSGSLAPSGENERFVHILVERIAH